MYRVEGRKNKKGEKNEKERRTQKKVHILAYARAPK